ncbi:MAG: type II toxin-antitoxin system RelE/ParE family toxin [Clostridia bacterium]|nr:type II toxin-antitoxin system RelE/ParE family toxin [Clostridia bacterium]
MYELVLYEDEKGRCEIGEYLKALRASGNKNDRIKSNKIRLYMNALAECGFDLNAKYIKKIDEEIWELRPLRDRILFVSWNNNKFILLCYFMKKTQKTPKREIERAHRLLEDYKRRSDDNE